MKLKQILCPTDFSLCSEAANFYASALAEATGAEIVYLHSVEPEVASEVEYLDIMRKEEQESKALQDVRPTIDNVTCSRILCYGRAADAILHYATERHVDLIIIGSHGRSGIGRLLLGSVAESVVRRAACPVLTVKRPADSQFSNKR